MTLENWDSIKGYINRPNLLLLTIDSVRADVLGCYGNPDSVTPSIDRFASSGVIFDQAITAGSWTQASLPGILTSSYASMYGGCLGPLSPGRPRLVGALADHGYKTAALTTNPLLSEAYDYDRDFDYFFNLSPDEPEQFLRNIKGGQHLLRQEITHQFFRLINVNSKPARLYVPAREVHANVLDLLEKLEEPYFLWIHYMDVHWPYHIVENLSQPGEIAQSWRDFGHLHRFNSKRAEMTEPDRARYIHLYEQALRTIDMEIGNFLETLAESGVLDHTIVSLVSDHGEEFNERGHWGHVEVNLYDEIMKVPWILKLPRKSDPQKISPQVSTVDIMPTILDLCDIPIPDEVEGRSLVDLLSDGRAPDGEAVAICERWRDTSHIVALRTEAYKFIWDSNNPEKPELYDLKADAGERHDISKDEPGIARHFQSLVDDHLQRVSETQPLEMAAAPDVDEKVKSRLKDLGYL